MELTKKEYEQAKESLTRSFYGHGHYGIRFTLNDVVYGTVTTNMPAIDAAFDEDYEGGMYKDTNEAKEALVNEIINLKN